MDSTLFRPDDVRVLVSAGCLEDIGRCVAHTTIKHGRIRAVVWHAGKPYVCIGLASFRGIDVAYCDRLCRPDEWPHPTRTYYQVLPAGLGGSGFWAGIPVQDGDGGQWVITGERVAFYHDSNK